jgi:Peptidase C13 family
MARNLCRLFATRLGAGVVIAAALLGYATGGIAAPGHASAQVQAVYDRQPLLLGRALADVRPTGARPTLYFVGFAAFAGQAVFKREVLAVRDLFDQRFGTRGRSLMLINHSSTAGEIPLATKANLDRALSHLGGIMDQDRDTLFLFLTSHGEKGLLAVDLPGFSLMHLTPVELRSMLDRSGIRNRVIVVSACHSGSFIPALAAPTSLVIAAAHADRTSFGCEDKRQWTYFGDAYFNRALREETSFTRAFTHAKRLVSQWEGAGRLTPSLPQIAGGEALPRTDWSDSARLPPKPRRH